MIEGAKIGPLASAQQLEDVAGFVSRAVSDGAVIAAGGHRLESPGGGIFLCADDPARRDARHGNCPARGVWSGAVFNCL